MKVKVEKRIRASDTVVTGGPITCAGLALSFAYFPVLPHDVRKIPRSSIPWEFQHLPPFNLDLSSQKKAARASSFSHKIRALRFFLTWVSLMARV